MDGCMDGWLYGCMDAYMVVYFGWLNACMHAGKTVRSYIHLFKVVTVKEKKKKKKMKKKIKENIWRSLQQKFF